MPRLRRGRSHKRQPSQCRNETQKLDVNHAEPAYDHTYCYSARLGKKYEESNFKHQLPKPHLSR